MHYHPTRITNADALEMVARRDLWASLATFIKSAPPADEDNAMSSFSHLALSEDRNLRAFLPLAATHQGLEFTLEAAVCPARGYTEKG
jgi:hypothetical protein